jgi:hypothetical protein
MNPGKKDVERHHLGGVAFVLGGLTENQSSEAHSKYKEFNAKDLAEFLLPGMEEFDLGSLFLDTKARYRNNYKYSESKHNIRPYSLRRIIDKKQIRVRWLHVDAAHSYSVLNCQESVSLVTPV